MRKLISSPTVRFIAHVFATNAQQGRHEAGYVPRGLRSFDAFLENCRFGLHLVWVPQVFPHGHIQNLQVDPFHPLLSCCVHDDTCCHDTPQGRLVPKSSRSSDNCKPRLQHPKSSLNTLSLSFLNLCKVCCLVTAWVSNCLDKGGP